MDNELLKGVAVLVFGIAFFCLGWFSVSHHHQQLCNYLDLPPMDYSQGFPGAPIRDTQHLCELARCQGLTPRRPPC